MLQDPKVAFRPSFINTSADVVVVGGGPVAFGIVEALQQKIGSQKSIILLERNNRFGGSGYASLKHFRTYQTHPDLSLAVKETVDWYEKLPQKADQVSLYRFPYVFIAKTQDQFDSFKKNLQAVRSRGFGKDAELVSPQKLQSKFPFIRSENNVVGALIYPDAGWLNLLLGIQYIIQTSNNTQFCLGTVMQKILVRKGKIYGVKTNRGLIKTDTVVLCPGQFVLDALDSIEGARVLSQVTLIDHISIQKRQSFEGFVSGLPGNTKLFLIAQNGAYVRINTDAKGQGMAMYGFADPLTPLDHHPKIRPKPDGMMFARAVYSHLAPLVPQYQEKGLFAVDPIHAKAGYYVETTDCLPIISDTNISGLYLCAALSHFGVMTHIGHGKRIADLIKSGRSKNNPFTLNRSFSVRKGSVL